MTLYDILGLAPSATADDIKKAWRFLAQRHHPDKGSGDHDKFQSIQNAYEVLSDPERRAHYDATGSAETPLTPEQAAEKMRHAVAMQLLQGAIVKALQKVDEATSDLVRAIRDVLKGALKDSNEALKANRKNQQRALDAAGRTEAEDNVLQSLLRGLADSLNGPIAQLEDQITSIELALEIAGSHTYRVDELTQEQLLAKMSRSYGDPFGGIFGKL